jgi:nucleotide-binding universal stress UspA family protein
VKALIPFDGSPEAQRAVDLVERMGFSEASVLGVGPVAEVRHGRRRRGRSTSDPPGYAAPDELERAAEQLTRAGLRAEWADKTGNVTKTIVETAAAGDFDVIVIGSRKRNAFVRALFGSTAEQVVRKARVAVVVVVR